MQGPTPLFSGSSQPLTSHHVEVPPSPDDLGCPKTREASTSALQSLAAAKSADTLSAESATPIDEQSVENDELQARALLLQAQSLNPQAAIHAQTFLDEAGDGMVQEILSQMQEESLQAPIILDEAVFRALAHFEAASVGINILSRATIAIATGMLLNRIEDVIKAKEKQMQNTDNKQEKTQLKDEVEKLNQWLKTQRKTYNSQLQSTVGMSLLSIPRGAFAIARIIEKTGSTVETTGNVFLVTSFIGEALRMRRAGRGLKTHADWALVVKKTPKEAQEIIATSKKNREKQKNTDLSANLLWIQQFLSSIQIKLQGKAPNIQAIVEELQGAGLTVPELSAEDLQEWLSQPERLQELNKAKQEMLSVSLRNALRTMCYKKEAIDRSFLKFSFSRSKWRFTAASVLTVLTVSLKIALYMGVASVGAALVVTGYGMVAAIVGSMIIGAIYLYVKKPNLFKTYVNGVQARLFFQNIPLAIQQYRRNYTVLKASKLFVEKEMLTNKNDVLAGKKQAQFDALQQKIDKLNASITKMETQVADLQESINEAGWKDFYRHLHGFMPPITTEDSATILAKHLLKDPAIWQDEETKNLLARMGVSLDELHGVPVVQVGELLRAFFAMDEELTVEMARRQT